MTRGFYFFSVLLQNSFRAINILNKGIYKSHLLLGLIVSSKLENAVVDGNTYDVLRLKNTKIFFNTSFFAIFEHKETEVFSRLSYEYDLTNIAK
jgi:hypothetical protein